MPQRNTDFPLRSLPRIESLERRQLLSANIVGTFTGHLPQNLPPGANNYTAVHLKNLGSSRATGALTVKLFASPDAILDDSDVPLTSSTRNIKLRPGRAQNVPLIFSSPANAPDGNYFFLAKIDTSAIPDAEPSINIAASTTPVSIHSPFADLTISFSQLPSRPIAIEGSSAGCATAMVKVTNQGNVKSHGTANLNLYLSADAFRNEADPLLATLIAKPINLRPGGAKTFTFRIAIPPQTSVGGYFLFASVAPAGGIVDTNPGNDLAMSANRVPVVQQTPHHHEEDQSDEIIEVPVFYPGPVFIIGSGDSSTTDVNDSSASGESDGSQPAPPATNDEPMNSNPPDSPTTQPSTTEPSTTEPTTQPSPPSEPEPPSTQPSTSPTTEPSAPDNSQDDPSIWDPIDEIGIWV